MTPTCSTCRHWRGTPESLRAVCQLPRMVHCFSLTGRDDRCPRYTAMNTPDISAPTLDADNGAQGKPDLVQLLPANYQPLVEVWG